MWRKNWERQENNDKMFHSNKNSHYIYFKNNDIGEVGNTQRQVVSVDGKTILLNELSRGLDPLFHQNVSRLTIVALKQEHCGNKVDRVPEAVGGF